MASISDNPVERQHSVRVADTEAHRQRLETIGRLASGVAHDFANLVTLIVGYSELLLNRTGPDDPARMELEEIRNAADRGGRLTAQLLGFTRNDSVRPQLLDLNQVIHDIERMLHRIIGENVELMTDCAPGLAKVEIDPGQIEQVIINLILNARDAMPAGGHIQIRTANAVLSQEVAERQGMKQGTCVLLIVDDTGNGIGANAMDHVFEPFFTTKEKGRGTGLGLSTVQAIVRQNGGAVWVASQLGEGATFTVCLPQVEVEASTASAPRIAKPGSGTETILLVEDDAGVRQLLARVLRDRGYTVFEARHSEEALQVFADRGADLDLMLTDVMMPGISGLELAERVRGIRPELKIVCMSGYTEDVLANSGFMAPGMPFLRKPLRPDALAAGVREALDSPPVPFNPR